MSEEIQTIERQLFELTGKLNELRKASTGEKVSNYAFETLQGETTLFDMFGEKDKLLLIHNMGQACRYCTLWADGFNGFLPHLESAMSVFLVSKDSPDTQQRFARSRNWGFRLASHGGGDYATEQTVMADEINMPGAVVYERDDKIAIGLGRHRDLSILEVGIRMTAGDPELICQRRAVSEIRPPPNGLLFNPDDHESTVSLGRDRGVLLITLGCLINLKLAS